MKRRFFYFLVLLLPVFAAAQNSIPDESQFVKDSLQILRVKLVRPQFRFDNRITFLQGQTLSITGFDLGVMLNEKLRLTLGYYTLEDHLKAYDYVNGEAQFGRLLEIKYGSLNSEFIYKNWRFLSLGMPLEIAAGKNTFHYKNMTANEIFGESTGALLFVNFGMSATFKPMRFLGLKAIVGYRKVVYNQLNDFNFDGFFTGLGVNVDLHAIVTDVRMYRLMKRYGHGNNIANAVDIITY